jgi:anti-sigma-K factor RskA
VSNIHSDIGGYVVDALDAPDREAFERHLSGCESCLREVDEFRETLGELTRLTAVAPPARVRSSVLAAIRTVRPLPPPEPAAAEATGPLPPSRSPLSWPEAYEPGERVPDEFALRRSRRLTRLLTGLVAAAVVAALALAGWVVNLSERQEALVASQQLETRLLSAPDARILTAETANGGRVSYVVSRQQSQALFLGWELPDPGPDRTYQLWTLGAGGPVPDVTVGRGGTVRAFFTTPVRSATAVAISIEHAGGSTTGKPENVQDLTEF